MNLMNKGTAGLPAVNEGESGAIGTPSGGIFSRIPRFSDEGQWRAGANVVKFFAALLVLTLIARGTSAATLTRVDLANPSRSEILEAVTGSATVASRGTLDITAPEGLTVGEMLIGVGQTVSIGDPIAVFDADEVAEQLARETASLDKLILDLDKLERKEETDAASLESARKTHQRAQEDYAATVAQGEKDILAAQKTLDEALASEADPPDTSAFDSAERSLIRAKEDYIKVVQQGAKDVSSAQSAVNSAQNNEAAKLQAWENAKASNAAPSDIAAAEQAYKTAVSETEKAEANLETVQQKDEDNLLSANRKVEDAQTSFAKAEKESEKSEQQTIDAKKTEIEKAQDALLTTQTKAADSLLTARRKVEDAAASLTKAQRDYNKSAQQTADTALQNEINAVSIRLDVDAQQSIVAALQTLLENENTLYANLEGVVASAKVAGSTSGKDALITLADAAKGFEAQIQLAKTDADRLSVGDACEVTTGGGSMYYSPTVTGTVFTISAPDDKDMVDVVVRLPDGDWTGGQRVSVQVVQSRSTYELCIPLSALHSDNSGYYLLTVEQTSTVLGIENTVTRVSVTVLASDGDRAAVQGPVSRNSWVITGSNKSISVGDRVRENAS